MVRPGATVRAMPDLAPSVVLLAVLGAGCVLAWLARIVVDESRRLAWGTLIVVAVLGAAVAWVPLDLLIEAPSAWLRTLVGIGGAVAAVAVASAWLLARERRRVRGTPDATVGQLIAMGEGERVEFKSTARWNTRTGSRDPRMEDEVAITVAGFMNAGGGTLLLGVDDDGTVRGLEEDLAMAPGHNRDGLQLWLRSMLAERLGRAVTADVAVAFENTGGGTVCRVDVAPADRPVFVGSTGGARTADFHLRVGNATRRLLTDEVLEYERRRWP